MKNAPVAAPGRSYAMPAFVAVWIVAFAPTWFAWARVWWTSPSYDFGLVLAACTLWVLVVRNRALVAHIDARWLAPLALASLGWMFVWLAGLAGPQQLAVLAWGLVAAHVLFGREQARLFPAIAWLVFASEMWEHVSAPLQKLVVAVVPRVMGLLGLPSIVAGNRITIPAGTFVVEEGCSGVKYLISLLALACVLIYTVRPRARGRWLLIGLAVALALLANWVRVGVLIAVGQATQMRSPMLTDHALFGWIVFAVAIVPMVLVARRLDVESPLPDAPATAAGAVRRRGWVVAAAVAAFLGPIGAGVLVVLPTEPGVGARLPAEVPGGWRGSPETDVASAPAESGGASTVRYVSARGSLRVARLRNPLPARPDGLETVLAVLDRAGVRTFVTGGRKGQLNRPDDRVIRFSERDMLAKTGLRKVTRFWFDVGDRSYAESAAAKLALALHAPFGARFMTITAVEAQCATDCRSAQILLDEFMASVPR